MSSAVLPDEPIFRSGGTAQVGSNDPTSLPRAETITIFAAASLTDAFLELGHDFETVHPNININYSFAGSQILRTQLEQGATADVAAFADQQNMDLLITDKLVAPNSYRVFAANQMVIILSPSNPAGGVQVLSDLARPGLKLVLADSSVPAGNYARQIFIKMSQDPVYGEDFSSKVMNNVVSNETDVRQVVTKVELGEADAGIVYTSDVLAMDGLLTVPIPTQYNVLVHYPIAVLAGSPNPDLAAGFVAYITSPAGQAVLSKWGFTPVR